MKAVICSKYGPPEVLQVKQVDKPVPKNNEVLIKVYATTVTRYDCWARSCRAHTGLRLIMRFWFGFRKPKQPVLGTELAGIIEAVGENVTRFQKGDLVYGYPGIKMGAYAEYIAIPEDKVALKPDNLDYAEAAAVLQGGLTSLYFLRKVNLQHGQKILILGASGGVGLHSVQLAKHYFGAEVTGVCSTEKTDLVESVGADEVIDYTKEDFTKQNRTYDVIFDTFGMSTFSSSRVLKENGTFLFATYGIPQILHILWLTLASSKKAKSPLLEETTEDLLFLSELIEAEMITPVIDKSYPMEQAVEAHRYVEKGLKKGNVVLTLDH